ncbi:CheY-like superfamily [Powellomyces hirtus]|nr:CheY-like superfamily [Powellomyces hirtus]
MQPTPPSPAVWRHGPRSLHCQKLVTAMGGTIRVDSVENMGATFTVPLTVLPPHPLASQPAVVPPPTSKSWSRKITPSPKIAVDLIRHSDPRAAPPYNIMLCDVNMPVMDGLTATRTIRTLPQGRDIYIIGLTANGFKKDRDDCLAAGMDAYLSKTVHQSRLAAAHPQRPSERVYRRRYRWRESTTTTTTTTTSHHRTQQSIITAATTTTTNPLPPPRDSPASWT